MGGSHLYATAENVPLFNFFDIIFSPQVLYAFLAFLLFLNFYLLVTPNVRRDSFGNIMDPRGGNRLKNFIALLMAKIAIYRETKKSKGSSDEETEAFHHAEDHPFFNESHYYNGCDAKTGDRIITRISRRSNGGKISYVFLLLDLGDAGSFALEKDFVDVDFSKDYPTNSGLSYQCIEPMKKWKLSYKGEMTNGCVHPLTLKDEAKSKSKAGSEIKRTQVEFELIYEVDTPVFWYMRDDNVNTLANNLSQEPWGYYFFLSCINRTKNHGHYEEYGRLTGTFKVNGKELQKSRSYDFGTFRDHSWDIRRWQTMDSLLILLIAFEKPLNFFGTECYYLDVTLVYMPGNLGGVQRYSTGYILSKKNAKDKSKERVFSMTAGTSILDIPYKTNVDGTREPMEKTEIVMFIKDDVSEREEEVRVNMTGDIRRLKYWPDEGAFVVFEDYMDFKITKVSDGSSVKGYGTRQSGFRIGEFDPTLGGCG